MSTDEDGSVCVWMEAVSLKKQLKNKNSVPQVKLSQSNCFDFIIAFAFCQ